MNDLQAHRSRYPEQTSADAFPYARDDEISLVDLWLVLDKRKWWIFGTALASLIAGMAFAAWAPKTYNFRTTIEVGTTEKNGNLVPIEQLETVEAKLENSYIPLVRKKRGAANGPVPDIQATVPKHSTLVTLRSRGPQEDRPHHLSAHRAVLDQLLQDHRRVLEVLRTKLEGKLERARIRLEELSDPRVIEAKRSPMERRLVQAKLELEELGDKTIFQAQRKSIESELAGTRRQLQSLQDQEELLKKDRSNLEMRSELLKERIEALQDEIRNSEQHRRQAAGGVGSPTEAMAQLMIDNELQQNRERLATLEERLYVGLPKDRAKLEMAIADNRRARQDQNQRIAAIEAKLAKTLRQHEYRMENKKTNIPVLKAKLEEYGANHERAMAEQKQTVAELENQLKNFSKTRAIVPPMQSLEPTNSSPKLIVALSIVLGLFAGVFLAFFVEFREKAKAEMAARAGA
ncbi:MAG TPA: Wzz/FepE/Etk N-terminal domain-containing protein [Gammaproteobacteria bacterium]|nr:Wzz/FepE/Etk N-terminal domain-containing protein [Gammaproteobacteria bacterium]